MKKSDNKNKIIMEKIYNFLEETYYVKGVRLSIIDRETLGNIFDLTRMRMRFNPKSGRMGFYEVLFSNDFGSSLMEFSSGEIQSVRNMPEELKEVGTVFFASLLPFEPDTFYYTVNKPYHILDKFNIEELNAIYSEFEVDDDFAVFIDLVVHKNYLKHQMNLVLDLNIAHGEDLLSKYEYYEVERAMDILYGAAMEAYNSDIEMDVFNTDYYELFIEMCRYEMFLAEGEPETYISILHDLFKWESETGTDCRIPLKYLDMARDNIFNLKEILNKKGITQTPKELIKLMDIRKADIDHQVVGMLTLVDLIHSIFNLDEIELTESKKLFSASTIRNLVSMSNFLSLEKGKAVKQSSIPVIDYLYHMLLAKDFARIEGTNLELLPKYDGLIKTGMDVLMSHLLLLAFDVEVISSYLGLGVSDGKKLIDEFTEKLVSNDEMGRMEDMNVKLLQLMAFLSVIKVENSIVTKGPLGNLYTTYLRDKSSSKAKVINLKDYKK